MQHTFNWVLYKWEHSRIKAESVPQKAIQEAYQVRTGKWRPAIKAHHSGTIADTWTTVIHHQIRRVIRAENGCIRLIYYCIKRDIQGTSNLFTLIMWSF